MLLCLPDFEIPCLQTLLTWRSSFLVHITSELAKLMTETTSFKNNSSYPMWPEQSWNNPLSFSPPSLGKIELSFLQLCNFWTDTGVIPHLNLTLHSDPPLICYGNGSVCGESWWATLHLNCTFCHLLGMSDTVLHSCAVHVGVTWGSLSIGKSVHVGKEVELPSARQPYLTLLLPLQLVFSWDREEWRDWGWGQMLASGTQELNRFSPCLPASAH